MKIRIWRYNWIVVAAICVHTFWGAVLLFSPAPLYTTPLAGLSSWPPWAAGFLFLTASGMASVPIIWPQFDKPQWAFIAISLQQWLMMRGFWTAMLSVWNGSYPDGYVPIGHGDPHLFIFVDQLWPIVGMIMHSVAVVDWLWYSRWETPSGIS